jgi:signal transduction histidine kinase
LARRDLSDGYDSAFGLPDVASLAATGATLKAEGPPAPSFLPPPEDSRVDLRVQDRIVAVSALAPTVRAQVQAALSELPVTIGGPEVMGQAAVVIAEVGDDATEEVGAIRRRTRADAALLLILQTVSAETVARGHKAGAFACLRPPLVREELLGLVNTALDSRKARVQAADLARKLDLESHLASIGRISAGLSHEVSSPLGAATLNMETVAREAGRMLQALRWLVHAPPQELAARLEITRQNLAMFEAPDGLAGAIADTQAAHGRIRALFQTMQGLVGRSKRTHLEPVALVPLWEETRKWLTDDLRGVEVETIGEPLLALADRTLLAQLLQNLVSNAAHAARSLAAPRVRVHVYAEGARVVLSVRDNGPGIPPELQERIFEPFFTTRRGQGGTGLGLALCREYARELDAQLSLWSVPGRGACFRVSLRRAK